MLDSAVAIPRKLKKPATSVTVVRMIDDDCARPAATIDITTETPITSASPVESLRLPGSQ